MWLARLLARGQSIRSPHPLDCSSCSYVVFLLVFSCPITFASEYVAEFVKSEKGMFLMLRSRAGSATIGKSI